MECTGAVEAFPRARPGKVATFSLLMAWETVDLGTEKGSGECLGELIDQLRARTNVYYGIEGQGMQPERTEFEVGRPY